MACILAHMTTLRAAGAVPAWTLGDRLRKAREHAGLSQDDLAVAIGVSRRSVSTYESGGVEHVKRPVLFAWATLCGVDLAWLEGPEAPDGTTVGTGKNRDSFHGKTWSHSSGRAKAGDRRRVGRSCFAAA